MKFSNYADLEQYDAGNRLGNKLKNKKIKQLKSKQQQQQTQNYITIFYVFKPEATNLEQR